ncbi:hypothetical protein LCGC14_1208770 [marine sediment metagenome]|uniref:RRXRR domain-containing protein n=1 Tax=marine sediment metagenome TaxID=412755 RepID=A0A0F9PJE0_9ZZZZ|nr:hypothetical protein [Pricia sp.]
MFVPVVNKNNEPLMPTIPSRARRWVRSGKATPFFKKGVFCVRLNVEPSNNEKQDIAVGIDPGSKREGYTIKSESHTYLNILTETPYWVSKAVEVRRNMRKARRFRLRRRPARFNNRKGKFLAPSARARWQLKLNICKWLQKIFPATHYYAVEDIKAKSWKGAKKWNKSFSPLEVGKQWFYKELRTLGELTLKQGYETKELRDDLGLKKSSSKLADKFECHNVDSWVLANCMVGGHSRPDNKDILKIIPLRFHRRQLHVFQCAKGGVRRNHGSTRSLGFKRGSLVKHNKRGLCYVGGTSKGRISLHSLATGIRFCQNAKVQDCVFKSYSSTRSQYLSP